MRRRGYLAIAALIVGLGVWGVARYHFLQSPSATVDVLDDITEKSVPTADAPYDVVARTQVNEIWRVPRSRPGGPDVLDKAELVVRADFRRDLAYLYFVDRDGNVARVKLAGGSP